MADVLLVGYDFSHGKDSMVLLVGRKKPNDSVDVINAFKGKEAEELYNRLTLKDERGEKFK
ncbi:hypothetical protein [Ruthenibacterium lactatiformans]|jgi:ATP-dependent DNA ligase|uniref:hypothetical protein n=1 Tax=Ruthenibacterium lactatiformans TaxID=1550024 RepID=UPI00294305C2|nr:hypothetical protein [Ruthenibacterium lactatiformans]